MPGLELKSFSSDKPFEVKVSPDGKITFRGYAATWHPDSVGDIIEKGAFAKTIKERGPRIGQKGKFKVLYQHYEPIGLVTSAIEDDFGLLVEGELTAIPLVKETVLPLLLAGVVDTMSIGFEVLQWDYREENGTRWRIIKEIKLYEVSPVTFPANENTAILAVMKSLRNHKEDPDTFLQKMFDMVKEMKAGKVLSKDSRNAIQKAIDSMNGAVADLSYLLQTADTEEYALQEQLAEEANKEKSTQPEVKEPATEPEESKELLEILGSFSLEMKG